MVAISYMLRRIVRLFRHRCPGASLGKHRENGDTDWSTDCIADFLTLLIAGEFYEPGFSQVAGDPIGGWGPSFFCCCADHAGAPAGHAVRAFPDGLRREACPSRCDRGTEPAGGGRAGYSRNYSGQRKRTIQGAGSGDAYQSMRSRGSIVLDRKSTRLNSSHQIISYAVFCLKKKK